jgi:DNA helicase HerA-like ATPase
VFVTDNKGDLSGIAMRGESSPDLVGRANAIGLEYAPEEFPVVFWDLFGEQGHPIRATVFDMGPLLVSHMLNLNDVQEGIINIAFRFNDDDPEIAATGGYGLVDLRDLRELVTYLSNAKEISSRYGNVAPATVNVVQRKILVLENQGGTKYFGLPALQIADLMRVHPSGRGVINLLTSDKLTVSPRVYSTFLLWLLSELLESLPEIGDPPKPKLVFFVDDAYLLFNYTSKALLDRIELALRRIRSKGVGVYFIAHNTLDVPDTIRTQLGNRVQHALRMSRDLKTVKAAAETLRSNNNLDTAKIITELAIGEALVSFLEGNGVPSVVERTRIRPPTAHLGAVSADYRRAAIARSPLKGKYDTRIEPRFL